MPRSAWIGLAALVTGALVLVRRRGRAREQVDLYFEDGSMVSLPADAPAAAPLVPLAREMLGSARV